MARKEILKAPFPWFGGKSRAAHLIWPRFGAIKNYVEPFAGSLAVLLANPNPDITETVNDLDCYLANFWRAVQHDPEQTAKYANWPVNEADLHARHRWLVDQETFRERMKTEPDYYDCKIAGWWVWGLSCWIGGGFCNGKLYRKIPYLDKGGKGVHQSTLGSLAHYFALLCERLRRVRVCCGDWSRALGFVPTVRHGLTGVFLDPPYAGVSEGMYCEETDDETTQTISEQVREWCLANGDNPKLRIALCGYEGEHELPGWEIVAWEAKGGYANQSSKGNSNRHLERIWFSPHCEDAGNNLLF